MYFQDINNINVNAITYLNSRITNPISLSVLVLLSIGYLLVYIFISEEVSFVLLGLTIAIPFCVLILILPDFGFLLLFFYSAFFFFINKHLLPYVAEIPAGLLFDIFLLFVLISYIISRKYKSVNISIKNPVIIILIIMFGYFILLIGNPAGNILDSILGFRFIIRIFISIILSIFFFRKSENYSYFVKTWFVLASLSMIYGIYQFYIGIPEFELKVAIADEVFYGLNFINGRWRIWSFLNNSTDFGLFMSSSAVFFLIYSLKEMSQLKRITLIVGSILMLIASVSSGTRTAVAIAVIGLLFFSLFEITNIKVIAALLLGVFLLIAVVFGPFYNPTAQRIRSTFFPKEDPSYMMREEKMQRFRPYIYSHPFGGGLNSLNSSGHFLSDFHTDSFYLKSFLEFGIIGTLLFFILFTFIISTGIKLMLKIRKNKYPVIALLVSFFILTIAGYTQISIYQFPYFFIFWGTIGYIATYKK